MTPVRFSVGWYRDNVLAKALQDATLYPDPIPRVGGLCPFITTPMPTPDNTPPDFAAECDRRAQELVGTYQTLYVLWSGGVDSTMVALYLAKHKLPHTNLILSISEQSTLDATDMVLEELKRQGFTTETISQERLREIPEHNGMVVSGHHADSILLGEFVDAHGIYEEIWGMNLVQLFMKHTGKPQKVCEKMIADLEPLLTLMPPGMERTAANVGWWLDFATFWDHDEYELMFRLGLKPPGVGYVSFFNTEGFQKWAQQDVRLKAGPTAATHKRLYLGLIHDMIGSEEPFVVKNRMVVPFDTPTKLPGSGMLKMRKDYSAVYQTW